MTVVPMAVSHNVSCLGLLLVCTCPELLASISWQRRAALLNVIRYLFILNLFYSFRLQLRKQQTRNKNRRIDNTCGYICSRKGNSFWIIGLQKRLSIDHDWLIAYCLLIDWLNFYLVHRSIDWSFFLLCRFRFRIRWFLTWLYTLDLLYLFAPSSLHLFSMYI
jgi:hypothetical protein